MSKAANDNTPRPDWYDQLLVEYLPFARKCAHRMRGLDDPEDLMQDFYVDACHRWAAYDPQYKFGTWVYQLIRNVASNRRKFRSRQRRSGSEVSLDADNGPVLSIGASQQDYSELSDVLSRLSGTRDSEALLRRAMGEGLSEIAADMGVSRERVRQISEIERKRLRKVVG